MSPLRLTLISAVFFLMTSAHDSKADLYFGPTQNYVVQSVDKNVVKAVSKETKKVVMLDREKLKPLSPRSNQVLRIQDNHLIQLVVKD